MIISTNYFVRQWLRLPKDTWVAFFQEGVKDGGLGILQLRKWVPIIKINRKSKAALWHSSSPMRMSFCLMLWKITAQFFANAESLESQKDPLPRNNWNKKPQKVDMTRSMDTDFSLFKKGQELVIE